MCNVLQVTDRDVCQVRLDFETFRLSPPSMTMAPFGQCSADRLAVFTTTANLGLSEGNLLCGDMTGQHSKQQTSSGFERRSTLRPLLVVAVGDGAGT
jgi:hypothetical protein